MKTPLFALGALIFVILVGMQFAMAVDLNQQVSDQDKASFDQILQPVMKVYNFVKYISTVIAAMVLLLAGITFMTSGSDPKKRDSAKSMAMYVIIGLVLIWAAPIAVTLIVG